MRIIVIGASAGLGAATVRAALTAGHRVTALARRSERLGLSDPKLTLATGDVLRPETLTPALVGQDMVIITLGMPSLRAMGFGRSRIIEHGTRNVIEAARAAGVRKLVTETAIGTGDSVRDIGPFAKLAYRVILGWLFRQKDAQERLTRNSRLDWTIVRPTALTNGPRTGQAVVQDHVPADLFTHVSRADTADFLVEAATESLYSRWTVTVTYPRRRIVETFSWLRHYR